MMVRIHDSGLSIPNEPELVDGIELAEGYEDQPADGAAYEGQSVLIFGQGASSEA